jgi:hypothetical protein
MILKRTRKGKAVIFLTRRLRGQANRASPEDPWASRYVVGQTEANSAGSLSREEPCELESPCCSRLMRS